MRGNDERHVHDAAATTSHMQKRRQPGEQTQQTNEKNGIEMRVLRATAEQGTRATRASRNTANATQNTDASQRRRVEGPKPRARKARRLQQHANETRHVTARTGRKSGTQLMKPSAVTQPARARRPDNMRMHHTDQIHTDQIQTNPRPLTYLTLLVRNFSTRRLNAKKAHRMRRNTYKQRAAL